MKSVEEAIKEMKSVKEAKKELKEDEKLWKEGALCYLSAKTARSITFFYSHRLIPVAAMTSCSSERILLGQNSGMYRGMIETNVPKLVYVKVVK